jgi:hypothetical protein
MIKDDVIVHKGVHLDNKNTSLCKNKGHSPKRRKLGDEVSCAGQGRMRL